MIDFESFKDYRRRAYVDAMMAKMEGDNVIGTFGADLPLALLYGFGLYPLPIIGIDKNIFQYGDYPACDPIKSTIVYLKTDKCPLQYSARMYLLSDLCPKMEESLRENSPKRVEVYKERETLEKTIGEVYGFSFDEGLYRKALKKFETIEELLGDLSRSNLSMKDFFLVSFFINYLYDLDERIDILKKVKEEVEPGDRERSTYYCPCPGGIFEKVAERVEENSILLEGKKADITCPACIYDAKIKINY